MRDSARALFAVVQRSKDDHWVLPRGKLKRDENPMTGARREVVEETGHRVTVHEFLGAITYRAGGRPKIVQFWRMQAEAEPSHELMSDIVAVEWLPLKAAIRRLSYAIEKAFLLSVGRQALANRHRGARRKTAKSAGKEPSKKSASGTERKTGKKPGKKTDKKAARKSKSKPARSHKPKAGLRGGAAKSRPHKSAASHKTAAATHVARKHSHRKHATPHRTAATPASVPAPERSAASTPAKSTAAAKRKGILQRMLGRLAG